MKIFVILVTKNEDDILTAALEHISGWADKIFVVDNGSADRTPKIISNLETSKIIHLGSVNIEFFEGIRLWFWMYLKEQNNECDWWCFADTDEFYFDDPSDFLEKIPNRYGVVCTNCIEYCFQQSDIDLLQTMNNFHRCKFKKYLSLDWSETRFFRNTKHLRFSDANSRIPKGVRAVYPKRIRVEHYPLRSAGQIQKRLDTRRVARDRGFRGWSHASQANWEEKLLGNNDSSVISVNGDLIWGKTARNFKSTSIDFVVRRWIKQVLYHFGIL